MSDFIITHAGHVRNYAHGGKSYFWRRQFAEQETLAQFIFDGTFGVIAPLLCVIFDPIVFRGGLLGGGPLFAGYRVFAYTIIFVEITALLMWLVGRRGPVGSRVLGGVLCAGALFSLVIGLALLPFSLFGIMFYGIGLCGFAPFLTLIIYLRNGRRALRHAQAHALAPGRRPPPALLSAVLVLALPAAAQWQVTQVVSRDVRALTEGDAAYASAATRRLKYVRWLTLGEDYDQLVLAYRLERDPARRTRIAAAYKEITGADIETRNNALID